MNYYPVQRKSESPVITYQNAETKTKKTSILINPTKGSLIWRIKLQEPTKITRITIDKKLISLQPNKK